MVSVSSDDSARKKGQRKPLVLEDQKSVRLFYFHREAVTTATTHPLQQCVQWRPVLMSRLPLRQSSQGKHRTQLERTKRKHWKTAIPAIQLIVLAQNLPIESLASSTEAKAGLATSSRSFPTTCRFLRANLSTTTLPFFAGFPALVAHKKKASTGRLNDPRPRSLSLFLATGSSITAANAFWIGFRPLCTLAQQSSPGIFSFLVSPSAQLSSRLRDLDLSTKQHPNAQLRHGA